MMHFIMPQKGTYYILVINEHQENAGGKAVGVKIILISKSMQIYRLPGLASLLLLTHVILACKSCKLVCEMIVVQTISVVDTVIVVMA